MEALMCAIHLITPSKPINQSVARVCMLKLRVIETLFCVRDSVKIHGDANQLMRRPPREVGLHTLSREESQPVHMRSVTTE